MKCWCSGLLLCDWFRPVLTGLGRFIYESVMSLQVNLQVLVLFIKKFFLYEMKLAEEEFGVIAH